MLSKAYTKTPRLEHFDLVKETCEFHAEAGPFRFGQWIWNKFSNPEYTGSWPELFYEKDYISAFNLVVAELLDHYGTIQIDKETS